MLDETYAPERLLSKAGTDPSRIETIEEPWIKAVIYTPDEYLGSILKLCQDRTALAQQAREKALKLLAKKAPVDEAEVARRKAAREAKEAAEAEKRAAKKAAIELAKAEKKAAAMVPEVAKPTEEELKAARDAKYAARKNRKK